MNTEIIFNVIPSSESGYEAQAIYTKCDKYDELPSLLCNAVKYHFSEADIPKLIRIHFVRDEVN